jgi:integrase
MPDKTLNEWLFEWLRTYKRTRQGAKTYRDNVARVRNHIAGTLGLLPLASVTAADIQNFLVSVKTSKLRHDLHILLGGAFRKAYALRLITADVYAAVEIGAHKPERRPPLTPEQQRAFLSAIAGHPYGLHFRLYLATGIRCMEIARLDFDFDRLTVHVRGTKTARADRYVPLHDSLAAPVRAFLGSGRSFGANAKNLSKHFRKAADKLGFDKSVTLHSLRHTFATNCWRAGIDIKTVQYWLGHSTIGMTADLYTHCDRRVSDFVLKQFQSISA